MKKLFTSMVMAFMLMAVPSHAQFQFGVTGGLNLSNLSTSGSGVQELYENNLKNKAGFFVGPTFKFTLPIVGLGIDASAYYDQRTGETADGETLKSQSLQIPVNVRYGIGLGSIANLFVFAGPQIGFNLGDKSITLKNVQDQAREWSLKGSNASVNLGAGALLMGHLQARINYNIALGKTGEIKSVQDAASQVSGAVANAAGSLVGITEAKANSWQVSLTYFF